MGDRRTAVIVVPIFMGLLATICVVLRLYARRIKRAPLGPDDYTIIVALVGPNIPRVTQRRLTRTVDLLAGHVCGQYNR